MKITYKPTLLVAIVSLLLSLGMMGFSYFLINKVRVDLYIIELSSFQPRDIFAFAMNAILLIFVLIGAIYTLIIFYPGFYQRIIFKLMSAK